jgi:transposase
MKLAEQKQKLRQPETTRTRQLHLVYEKAYKLLPNYTLSTVCPACEHATVKLACKVRCPRCGFMWDCSEL